MNWTNKQVTLFSSHSAQTGELMSLRNIIFCESLKSINDILTIRQHPEKKQEIKNVLPCFSFNAMQDRKTVIEYTGLMQLDFDYKDCQDFDIEEMKQAVFSLPFIGFCGLSCSGTGFYAIAAIADPQRQAEYAHHIFKVLETYGITADVSKGKNPNELRYVSYDSNMLVKDNVEPLKIAQFKANTAPKEYRQHKPLQLNDNADNSRFIHKQLQFIYSANIGERWATVQRVSYTLGGANADLQDIVQAIENTPAFAGMEKKYIECARHCFNAGLTKPL